MSFRLVTPSDESLVSLEDVKKHLVIEFNDDDLLLNSYRLAATSMIENYLGYALAAQVWRKYSCNFSDLSLLPNVKSVNRIVYKAQSGEVNQVDSEVYSINLDGFSNVITLNAGQTWPVVFGYAETPVMIEFTVGKNLNDIPTPIKQACLLLVGHFYANRETTNTMTIKSVPLAFEALLAPYQLKVVG